MLMMTAVSALCEMERADQYWNGTYDSLSFFFFNILKLAIDLSLSFSLFLPFFFLYDAFILTISIFLYIVHNIYLYN